MAGPTADGHGLQNHPKWHADDALQLLLPKRLHGRRLPLRGAGPGHRWEPLRDNDRGRGHTIYGTVFKITPSGTLTTLHSFADGTDGDDPNAGLVQATNGNFYGTTIKGGAYGGGTVFKITPSGTLTTLYSFCSKAFPNGRQSPLRGAGPGHRWELLRDNGRWRGPQSWDGLQNHPKRHADDAAQFRRHGRPGALRGAGPGHQWELLRDNGRWRGPQSWDSLQNHPKRHADDAAQLSTARTARSPTRVWSRTPMGPSTGQRTSAGRPTPARLAVARSSKSPQAAR